MMMSEDPPADTHGHGRDHCKGTRKFISMPADRSSDDFRFAHRGQPCQSYEDDTKCEASQAKHQLSEVFVSREQQSSFMVCQVKHCVVRNARFHLSHIQHMVTTLPEKIHNLPIHTLVSQEFHATASAIG